MMETNEQFPVLEESDPDRQQRILDAKALSADLVSALAGDRVLTETEKNRLDNLKISRGLRFFSDLLYSITHQYFPPETAEHLWDEIIRHKYHLSAVLGRNARTIVAALDYLSNITGNMHSPTLVGEAAIEELVGLSLRDGLTGLFNHTYFFQQMDLEVRRAARYDTIVSLILIDIDDFKAVNDTYGHQEGDRVLASMGKSLTHEARDSDICCRFGGEEFAVILPSTDVHLAGIIADRMRVKMADHLPGGGRVSVSIGVASYGKMNRTCRDLVASADAALYQVKRSGKDRVEIVAD